MTDYATSRLTSDPESARRLGAATRALRTSRGLTLRQVAEAADLSYPFLSQVERGIHQPSIASLQRIAVALGTSPVELIAAAEPPADAAARVEVVRAGEGAVPESFSDGPSRVLAFARAFHPIEVDVVRSDRGETYRHAEGEFLYVVSGVLRAELDDEEHTLAACDSAYVAGGVPHAWWAASSPVRLLIVKDIPRT